MTNYPLILKCYPHGSLGTPEWCKKQYLTATSSSLRLFFLSLLTNTLPGPSASEITTLWHYTNLLTIIIIIIITAGHMHE